MCKKGTWVKNIKPNETFQGFFHVMQRQSPIRLADASGIIPISNTASHYLKSLPGNVAWLSGQSIVNNDTLSIHILSALPTVCWTGNPFALIEPKLPGYEYASTLYQHVQSIQEPDIHRLIEIFFADTQLMRGFMSAPASLKHHHAYPGGLARHTTETLDMAASICTTLGEEERALVMAACLLHDAGKAFEYNNNRKYLSPRGNLLGHEITLLEMLAPVLDKIWERGHPKRLMLLHLLTAKPAPQWTGIRHPRTRLVSIVRFADRWSSCRQQ